MQKAKTAIETYLDERKIAYEGIDHPPAASAEEYNRTLNTRYEQQAKVLLVKYTKDGAQAYAVLAIQGHKRADLDKLKQVVGATKLRLADKEQLKEMTGCNFGELHPFAGIFGLPLWMDKDLLAQDRIYINAGCLDYSVIIDPKEVQKLESPLLF